VVSLYNAIVSPETKRMMVKLAGKEYILRSRLPIIYTMLSAILLLVSPISAQEPTPATYTLIKGTFHIHYPDNPRSGPQPDGDTIKFKPHTRSLVEALPRNGRPPKFTQTGITTIRFEGIDTLETHFQGTHQHEALALEARDVLLENMGFGAVTFHEGRFTVETVEHHPIPGYILSNGLDVHERVIAFVFTDEHQAVDGSHIAVQPSMLDSSLNATLLKKGQAYAVFYVTLPVSLREHLKIMAQGARAAGEGLWAKATA